MTQQRGQKNEPDDWHPADVVAALRKAGWSLRRLAKHHGYASPTQLTAVMQRSWPKGQRLIAEAIGVAPETIWPTRYQEKPTPGRPRKSDNQETKAA